MNSFFYISAIILGFGGSLHCLGMCGPLVMSLPFNGTKGTNKKISVLVYLLSKAVGYGIIGLIFGAIGKSFLMLNWQQNLSIIAGIVLLLITVIPYLKEESTKHFLFTYQFEKLYNQIIKNPKVLHFAMFGILNAFLPCGLVYAAIAGATITSSPFSGFIFMFLFGLGTSPALFSIILFSNKLNFSFRKYIKSSSYYLSLLMAVVLILRGMNLGIPYISPIVEKNTKTKTEIMKCGVCKK